MAEQDDHPHDSEVTRLEILRRDPFMGDTSFGAVGTYERLSGRVYFSAEPESPCNIQIVDLIRAPRNPQGRVEWSSDFYMLKPVDLERGNAALFYEVNNRGNKLALSWFNDAPGNFPEHAGNAFFMRRGFTILWSGWIGEVLPGNGRLTMLVPVARDGDEEIIGPVRCEMAPDAPAERLNIAHFEGMGSYEPTERGAREAILTWRLREADPRVPIHRSQFEWCITRPPGAALPRVELQLRGGFQPGCLYELIYEAKNPIVQGLGLAGIRDLVSFFRYSDASINPLAGRDGCPAIRHTYAFGASQSGRCLRQFLYQGFNADAHGRKVFDGVIPHVSGAGLGSFNHRFASPTRHNTQHDNHAYPADVFPFAYSETKDPATGRIDGLLHRAQAQGVVPRIFHTQTSAEYWSRSASLAHTDPSGREDLPLQDEVRFYVFGGAQHGPGTDPPRPGLGQQLSNPVDYRPFLRALLMALDAWIRESTSPPPSMYPTFSEGTLRNWDHEAVGFPPIPGVRYPTVIQQPSSWDFGPRFIDEGIMTIHPPKAGLAYGVRVPGCDEDGNELGTLRLPRVAVPLGTYTGWSLRSAAAGAENELISLNGSFIPFPKNASEREERGDPRSSVLERYTSFSEYKSRYLNAVEDLQERRFLLPEDATLLNDRVERFRSAFE